jgi:hypothetical protein
MGLRSHVTERRGCEGRKTSINDFCPSVLLFIIRVKRELKRVY